MQDPTHPLPLDRRCFSPWSGRLITGWFLFVTLLTPLSRAQLPDGATPAQWTPKAAEIPDDGKLRIIAFGAHPDDCEIQAGGVAAKWAKKGHKVKFVSLTNGDIGHWQMAGGPLAQRRLAEVKAAAKILGIEVEVLDNHDGELMPTLENRRKVIRLIREWKADVVICHRPNDYHPDHRNTGLLVRDAAYMVMVPYICPEVPYLPRNPAFFYSGDRFQRPNPFRADVVVSIDDVVDKKLEALAGMESQFSEGGCCAPVKEMPKDRVAARAQVKDAFNRRFQATADHYRDKLLEFYGAKAGPKVRHAEAFEICEYGSMPGEADLRRLFPFFGQ
jgi:N-acetylglucosamine malate deacetylase 1